MGKRLTDEAQKALDAILMPPHSEENEEATIAAVLNNPDVMPEIAAILKPSDFFLLHNGFMFKAMLCLYRKGMEIDLITVIRELENMGKLQDVGGAAKVQYYSAFYPGWMNGISYAYNVQEDSLRRRILKACIEINRYALDRAMGIDEVTAKASQELADVTKEAIIETEQPFDAIIADALDELDEPIQGGIEHVTDDLTKVLGVMLAGDLVVVAARSGVGKSRMLLQVILNAAKKGKKCLLFTTELTRVQVVNILIEMQSKTGITAIGIRDKTIKKNLAQHDEYIKLATEMMHLKDYIHVISANEWSVEKIRGRILRDGEGAWDLIGIDYIQRLRSVQKFDKKYELYGHIAQTMKNTAMAMKTVIISPSQTNRDGAKSGGQGGDNLSGSDQILHESDMTLIVSRDDAQNPTENKQTNQAQIFVAKGRFGAQGRTIPAYFHPMRGTYENMTKPAQDGAS